MVAPLLVAKDLACERDDRMLFSRLGFELDRGEILQLSGPNGAGKTSLLRILASLFTGYSGTIQWRGENLARCLTEFQQDSLYLGHKSGIKPTMTAIENLRFLCGLGQRVSEQALMGALQEVGLAGYEHSYCRNLSAGQQRRVALARLYLSTHSLWLLDEIFTAIDLAGVKQFEALLLEKSRQGVAIILTTHHKLDIADVKELHLQHYAGGHAHEE